MLFFEIYLWYFFYYSFFINSTRFYVNRWKIITRYRYIEKGNSLMAANGHCLFSFLFKNSSDGLVNYYLLILFIIFWNFIYGNIFSYSSSINFDDSINQLYQFRKIITRCRIYRKRKFIGDLFLFFFFRKFIRWPG